jgi:hypothetical protein
MPPQHAQLIWPPVKPSKKVGAAPTLLLLDAFTHFAQPMPILPQSHRHWQVDNSQVAELPFQQRQHATFEQQQPSNSNVKASCSMFSQMLKLFPCDLNIIILGGTPSNYEYWLVETIKKTMADFPGQERLVFINAWNEWAEGCHLEPDRKFQRQFLEATLRAKSGQSALTGFSGTVLPGSGKDQKRSLIRDLCGVFAYHASLFMGRLVGLLKKFPRIRKFVRWLFNKKR